MISAKELNKIYKESNKVQQSQLIVKEFLNELEPRLVELANKGFLEFHLEREDGDELSDLFFRAVSHWEADDEGGHCTDEADVSLVQRKVFEALIDAGFTAGWDGSTSRIEISWAFPNEAKTNAF